MSVISLKTLSVVRNSHTRSGQCLKFFRRNVSESSKSAESNLKVAGSEPYVNPLANLGKVLSYILCSIANYKSEFSRWSQGWQI